MISVTNGFFIKSLIGRHEAQKQVAQLANRPVVFVPRTIYIPMPIDSVAAAPEVMPPTLPDVSVDAQDVPVAIVESEVAVLDDATTPPGFDYVQYAVENSPNYTYQTDN